MKSQLITNAQTTRRVALTILGTILCLATTFGLLSSSAQAQDFTLSVSPSSVTLPQGTPLGAGVNVNFVFTPSLGPTTPTLNVGGLPAGVSGSFTSVVSGSSSATLTLTAPNSAPTIGVTTLTITATDDTGSVTQNVSLNVVANPVPYIDSVAPLSETPGSGGFSLTVYGGGFINGFSQIMWTPLSPPSPSVPLSNVTCTAFECSATAPSGLTQGTAAITVVNAGRPASNVFIFPIIGFAPAVGYTPANSAGCTTPCQNSPVSAGNGPSSVAVADFTGHGIPDLAVTNKNDNTVSILLGNGNGTFTPQAKSPFATGLTPVSVAVGDFNNDGKLDLAIVNACGSDLTCSSRGTVSILLGNGDGSFTATTTSPGTDYTPTFVAVGDFNGDGNLDLAVANSCGGTDQADCAKGPTNGDVTILLGDGTGNFTSSSTPGTDPNPVWIAVGDFANSGWPDLVVANAGTPSHRGTTLTVMSNSENGSGNFSTSSISSNGISPVSVGVGDFNGDGYVDVAVANACGTDTSCSSAGNVVILAGTGGTGNFLSSLSTTAAGTGPSALAVADLNGDNKLDVAVADATGSTISILLGNGAGGLTLQSAPASPITGATPVGIAISDFNGDGGLDLVTANSNSANVSVLLAAPTVTLTCGSSQATGTTCSVPVPPKTGPPVLSFGSWPAGGTLGAMTVTVTNNSNLQLILTELAVSSGDGNFYLDPATTTCGPVPPVPPPTAKYIPYTPPYPTVAAGSSCTIGVDFNPQTPGVFTGVVQITDNGAASPQTFSLQGTGAAAAANVSPTTLPFGDVTVLSSSELTVTLSNTGTTSLNITSIMATSPYIYDMGNSTCGTTLAALTPCTIAVKFAPSAAGYQGGTLTVEDSIGSQSLTQTVALTGTGIQAVANLSTTTLMFNNQLLGTSSVAQPIQLSNTGAGTLTINTNGITITQLNAGEFAQTNDCGTSVPGYGNCTIYVTFSPSGTATAANQTATLNIAGNTVVPSVGLSGTEIYPVAGVSPGSLPFTQTYGSTSASQIVTLSNTGNYALNINNISIGGTNPSQFAETTTCLTSLPASQSCSISVTFTASQIGSASATLTITDNSNEASGSTQTVNLTGSVNKSNTLTTITSNTPNPQMVGLSATVSFTVGALAPGVGTPTGTVTISDGVDSCIGSLIQGEGSCSIPFSFGGGPGSKTLTATYSGDPNFSTSTGGGSQTVIKANTSTVITSNTPNPSIVGLPIKVSFAVAPNAPGVGIPTGAVTVSDGTGGICTGSLSGGTGTCAMTPKSPSSPGAKALIASYAGDGNFNASTSPSAAQTVTKANTTTSILSLTPNSVVVGQPVTVQLSVTPPLTPPPADILTPTGTVTVTDGVGDSCSVLLAGSVGSDVGTGTCTFKPSAPGPLTITASYPGDSNFNASSASSSSGGAPGNLAVGDFGFTVGPPTETISSGHTATYTVTITALGGLTGNIALSCSDPAPQTTCSISPATVAVGGKITSTITVVASKAAAHGSWTLTFTGKYGSGIPATGGLTHTTSAYLVIK